MASSSLNNDVDWNIIETKSEPLTSSTDRKDQHLKCLYNYLFHDIEPSNEQKLRILNDVIVETAAPDELRNYHMKRAQVYFNMREWKNAINNINQMERYGELDGQMVILKIKATLQYEFEKAQQLIADMTCTDNFGEYLQLSKTIHQMKEMVECTDQTKRFVIKRFRS